MCVSVTISVCNYVLCIIDIYKHVVRAEYAEYAVYIHENISHDFGQVWYNFLLLQVTFINNQ